MYNRTVTSDCNLSSIGRTDWCRCYTHIRIRLSVVLTRRWCDVVVVKLLFPTLPRVAIFHHWCIVVHRPLLTYPHLIIIVVIIIIILNRSTPVIVVSSSVSYSSSLFDCCVIIICSVVLHGRRGVNMRMGHVLANDSFPVNCHIFLHWQPLNFLIPIIELAQIEQGHTHQWCSGGARVLGWEALTVLTRQSIIPLS